MQKPKWAQGQTVVREYDKLTIYDLSHARVASDFIREVNEGLKAGFDDFLIEFDDIDRVYPNSCVPLSGILNFYTEMKKVKFTCEKPPLMVVNTNLLKPKLVKYSNETLSRNVMNKVWRFGSGEEVNQFVSSMIEELSKSERFQSGVLVALEWSLNEIMDNVIQHSNCNCGYAMGQIHKTTKHVAFTVYDHGQGFINSLRNSIYAPKHAADAIMLSIQEGVTRDKKIGQGNGLYGLNKIVNQNNGILSITSAGASCRIDGDDTKIYNRLPFLSHEFGAACVDFQLDINNPVSLSEALSLKGQTYKPVSLREEAITNDIGEIYYKVSEKSAGTGTRQSAERLRNDILNYYSSAPKSIILDFDGVSVMSSSFADELIGKLVIEFGFFEFNRMVKIINMNETLTTIAQRSIYQRIIESTK
jgi:hypothetical protein